MNETGKKLDQKRCAWCEGSDIYEAYHDEEWGRPLHDDRMLFEFLILEGAQAGLSWITILKKRDAYRRAFDGFDPEKIARYDDEKMASLMNDAGIVRNRAKIAAAVTNAKKFLDVQREFGSFDKYIWSFTDGKAIDNAPASTDDVPAETDVSKKMSRDLKKRGFKFVGPTICYAFMQAVGIVNDHMKDCWTRGEDA